MSLSHWTVGFSSGTLIILGTGVTYGQDFPQKVIRIVTAAAGGGSDFPARLIAQGISGPIGQPVVVENRGTALGSVEGVIKAPPDGYTLLVVGSGLWLRPLLEKMPYDAVRDVAPVSLISREVFVVVVHPSVPVKSIKELIALAKARPGQLDYTTGSTGGPGHLGGELFKSMAGISIVRIAYKGTVTAVTGLVSGDGQLAIADLPLVMPHTRSGKLRALAVTSPDPSALAPGLPTVSASGLPGYELVGATGVFTPAKTPGAIINRLNQEIVRFLTGAEVKEKILSSQAEVVAGSPEQFDAFIKADIAKWSKVIKDAGIKVN